MAVNLADLIHRGGVLAGVEGSSPEEIYKNVAARINLPEGLSPDTLCNALCAREKIMSTAVGNGIALPHARVPVIKEYSDQRICVAYLKNPIDMNAPDERKVQVMFIILSSEQKTHLEVLSNLVGLFQENQFKKLLEKQADEAELLNYILNLS